MKQALQVSEAESCVPVQQGAIPLKAPWRANFCYYPKDNMIMYKNDTMTGKGISGYRWGRNRENKEN